MHFNLLARFLPCLLILSSTLTKALAYPGYDEDDYLMELWEREADDLSFWSDNA
jgi:hypothetical protein